MGSPHRRGGGTLCEGVSARPDADDMVGLGRLGMPLIALPLALIILAVIIGDQDRAALRFDLRLTPTLHRPLGALRCADIGEDSGPVVDGDASQ